MNSPYVPPQSSFETDASPTSVTRWHTAAIFAAIPLAVMVFYQASLLYPWPLEWNWTVWEPSLYITPIALITAASGYAGAQRCAAASLTGVLPLGGVIGCIWSLLAVVAGKGVLLMQGTPQLPWRDQIGVFIFVAMFLVPLAIVLCGWARYFTKALHAPVADKHC